MENPVVKVEHLSHRYSVQWAIRDINFEIYEKGILGLLGSNGAGKSTTMNIMCGVLNQTEGEVYINGINFREDPIAAKMNIGFLPQKPPLYTDLTVEEYLAYCADLRSVAPKKIRSSVDYAMEVTSNGWVLRRQSYTIRSSWCWMSRRMDLTRTRSWKFGN